MKQIAASIMCADQLNLKHELSQLEHAKVDLLHCDVMDGVYVKNLALGPEYLARVKSATTIPLDIHLATVSPLKYAQLFASIQPMYISFHIETCDDVFSIIDYLRDQNIRPSIAINPLSPISLLEPYLSHIDMILLMTVNPGFAGQKIQLSTIDKIAQLKMRLQELENPPLIEVDGNINLQTIKLMENSMPDVFVLGTSALFNQKNNNNYTKQIMQIRKQIELKNQ
ncbi:ribulose phosphate epimerase [Gilliamella sp. wkB72]|uniref:ribulose-phosphate 3-epimerase n=1 Tax=unclassified Gilliamella TaxID=2685620 RepID=UPI00081033BF|nr:MULTISPECIES: ribulose-phosphate 3-epimerase [Gilliamella]MCX8586441.1 ribulose-phosphate 3-epimerase [Gilliamella sp. B3562]MCX8685899.1 ribulose-phosphate 3-epimerase [Gilliamella sp. B2864]OCL22073.1 ribulose phosphate epimerase [Gilliamella apicola]